ncbi:MAG TPA: capsid cement protein [Planctomycetota bacterium]|nr:capsid cement protein [Planctomycetota bacterium]
MASSQTNAGIKAFTSAEALAANRRVKLSTGALTVEYADAGAAAIGVTQHACASGDPVSVKLTNVGGTVKICAADTFAVAATLYGANDGKVSDTSSGTAYYYACEECTGAGDMIECIPIV